MKTVKLSLTEEKKHSGKYVVQGTENDQYPSYYYFPKKWFEGEKLPDFVEMSVKAIG